MHPATRYRTVTAPGWNVSTLIGGGRRGAQLHVFRVVEINGKTKLQKGDGYGRRFKDTDAATAWAFERGYLQPFFASWCPRCRVRHTGILGVGRSSWCATHSEFIA